jgi:hypothetical protein
VVSDALMPGGGVARRPLHLIIMGDCSGSMKGPKMQALNIIAETIDVIVDRLVAASIAVSQMSKAGADGGALAQQLLRPEVVPGSGLAEDPIL